MEIKVNNKATAVNLTNVVYNNSSAELTSLTIHNEPQSPKEAVNKEFVENVVAPVVEQVQQKLSVEGGEVTGPIKILVEPVEPTDAVTKAYVDQQDTQIHGQLFDHSNRLDQHQAKLNEHQTAIEGKLDKTGGTIDGSLKVLRSPLEAEDVATKAYVDSKVGSGQETAVVSIAGEKVVYIDYSNEFYLTDYDSISVYEVINLNPDIATIKEYINTPDINYDKKYIVIEPKQYPGTARFIIKRDGAAKEYAIPVSEGKVNAPNGIDYRRNHSTNKAYTSSQRFDVYDYNYIGVYSTHADTEVEVYKVINKESGIFDITNREFVASFKHSDRDPNDNPYGFALDASQIYLGNYVFEEDVTYLLRARFLGSDGNGKTKWSDWSSLFIMETEAIYNWFLYSNDSNYKPKSSAVTLENDKPYFYSLFGNTLLKSDKPGKIVWKKDINQDLATYGIENLKSDEAGNIYLYRPGYPNIIITNKEGTLVKAIKLTYGVVNENPMIVHMTPVVENNVSYIYAYVSGTYQDNGSYVRLPEGFVKLDTDGNVIWFKKSPENLTIYFDNEMKYSKKTINGVDVVTLYMTLMAKVPDYGDNGSFAAVMKVNSDGEIQWVNQIRSPHPYEYNHSTAFDIVTVDNVDYIYVAGYDKESPKGLTSASSPGATYIMKFDENGNFVWKTSVFNYYETSARDMKVVIEEGLPRIYVTGSVDDYNNNNKSMVYKLRENNMFDWAISVNTSSEFDDALKIGYVKDSSGNQHLFTSLTVLTAKLNTANGVSGYRYMPNNFDIYVDRYANLTTIDCKMTAALISFTQTVAETPSFVFGDVIDHVNVVDSNVQIGYQGPLGNGTYLDIEKNV